MKIVVLVKQVPVVSAMKLDPETKTLKREGVPSEVSSFDVRALLKAVELRTAHGGEVVALTMGPPQAKAALEHCLALGADRGVLLTDRAFAGADTLATARAVALALKKEGYDLVLCGRYSTDAETGQVGPEVAELLDLPQITAASKLTVAGNTITVERETDVGFETVSCSLPALVSATEDLAPEKFPNKADKEKAKEKPIQEVRASDLAPDLSQFGAAGSPTWVESVQTVEVAREKKMLEGELPAQVDTLVQMLLEQGLFGKWKGDDAAGNGPVTRTVIGGKAVWVVAETLGDTLPAITLELLGKANELASNYGGEVGVMLMGWGVDPHVATLAIHGADVVYLAQDRRLVHYSTDLYTAMLAKAIREHQPGVVLFGSTATGRDLAPRVAARLGLGLTGDCVDLEVNDKGQLLQYKPAFGGNIVAPILSRTSPEMATVRPGMLKRAQANPARQARIEMLWPDEAVIDRVRIVERTGTDAGKAAALDSAEITIGIGKGVGGTANLPVIEQLAEVLGGAPLAATRDIVDLGWLPRQHQVGLTGRAIAPKLYFAIGIRGAFEHTVGVRRAGIVVAINKNQKAPMFQNADIGIVGDYAAVVPLLTEKLREAKARVGS
ncbi:MAG: electron transfer flavoprotein alpha/ beta subunit [Deltaproteobacteria bacterium]|nr:electron transfer flavoprotein alpha/ beta subunit [Deltaproteobacteria bacterium]